jgi:hypothetical protein
MFWYPHFNARQTLIARGKFWSWSVRLPRVSRKDATPVSCFRLCNCKAQLSLLFSIRVTHLKNEAPLGRQKLAPSFFISFFSVACFCYTNIAWFVWMSYTLTHLLSWSQSRSLWSVLELLLQRLFSKKKNIHLPSCKRKLPVLICSFFPSISGTLLVSLPTTYIYNPLTKKYNNEMA